MKLHRVYALFCVVLAGWWVGMMSAHGFTWYRVTLLCASLVAFGIHVALAMVDRGDE
jgi:hypothetical protein